MLETPPPSVGGVHEHDETDVQSDWSAPVQFVLQTPFHEQPATAVQAPWVVVFEVGHDGAEHTPFHWHCALAPVHCDWVVVPPEGHVAS